MPRLIVTSDAQQARVNELRGPPVYWYIVASDWSIGTSHNISERLYDELAPLAAPGPPPTRPVRKLVRIKWWEVEEANLPLDIPAEM